ncbi:MAG TPA: biopolymer transporter ExbD [Flavisolibacter sp.]|nr:biopolymer transporter ExbD [Flavisolibacter sp.]
MAAVQLQSSSKRKLLPLRIDMTPMVDLGFLLITFFILTTSMAEPNTIKLVMPANGKPTPVKKSKTLTALLDRDKVYLYQGEWKQAEVTNTILESDYNIRTGFGNFIRLKQKQMEAKGEKEDLLLIIKPLPSSSYQNIITALDEVLLNNLHHYAVVDVTEAEKKFVSTKQ